MNKKMHFNGGTYVIRKCDRKNRVQLFTELKTPPQSKYLSSGLNGCNTNEIDLKRYGINDLHKFNQSEYKTFTSER